MKFSAKNKTNYYSSRIDSSTKGCEHYLRQGPAIPFNQNK